MNTKTVENEQCSSDLGEANLPMAMEHVRAWNQHYPTGTQVRYLKSPMESCAVMKTSSEAYLLGYQAAVDLERTGPALLMELVPALEGKPAND
ncbi:hypothetical protein [Paucibacter soli]|uniref:hypothetical protein n=1 Tax=Paucibacter soli TaxID=3133433 RepID=UPI0030A8CAC0